MSGSEVLNFADAAIIIKDAIVRSRYKAAKLVNMELLSLYYGVGKYVSENSRGGYWGQGALKQLSEELQRELPGLRGFSESSIRRMRLLYEAWVSVFTIHPSSMDELEIKQRMEQNAVLSNHPLSMDDLEFTETRLALSTTATDSSAIDLSLLSRQMAGFTMPGFSADAFFKVGFTHHTEILAKEKSLDGRLYYIAQCRREHQSCYGICRSASCLTAFRTTVVSLES
jgi:hypothetical protein